MTLLQKTCENCNVPFETKSFKAKCCSQKCNMTLWRKNNPEKVKEQQQRNDKKRAGIKRYNPKGRKIWYEKKNADLEWKNKIRKQAKERRTLIQDFLNTFKLEHGCADCGYKEHPVALDFDHVNSEKSFSVCYAKSIEQAKKEIEKCEVVCSNCHRIRTYKRLKEGL